MTDDIITRLRSEWPDVKDAREAADALEAKDKQIEALELELKVRLPIQEYKAHLKARIAELEAENAKLRTALKPFSDAAGCVIEASVLKPETDHWQYGSNGLKYGDLRAAHAALGEKE